MLKVNPLYFTDGYKVGHRAMLAPGTTRLYGTWIPRSTKHAPGGIKKIVSFGQQLVWRWIHDVFQEYFFNGDKNVAVEFGKDMSDYLGIPYNSEHFIELHRLGYLPIEVKSLPEGIETDPNVPHMTFINTKDGFAWLTLYLETIVSSLAWKPSTSATIALQYRRNVEYWVSKTDLDNKWLIPFLCHDFSARGLNPHDMISSGLGHATCFRGSDTLAVIPAARYYYGEKDVCINSVNASEHSVSTTKIFTVGEQQMLADWMKIFPTGILSVVSDTFDLWKLITEFLPALKSEIMARDGKLVIRPDSGDPVDIVCGLNSRVITNIHEGTTENILFEDGKYYKIEPRWGYNGEDLGYEKGEELNISESELKGVIELLWDIFGGTISKQGYRVLDSHIGAIYGDSINLERQIQIYERLAAKGFAATNIVLGVGSFTYQFNTRDTFGFAAKGAWFETMLQDGSLKAYNIFKDPVTDDGGKRSLKGLQAVHMDKNGNCVVQSECTWEEEHEGILQTIYRDGRFYKPTSLTEVRERINLLI